MKELPFTKKQLDQEVKDRFVSCQKHPDLDLFIYNYTQRAQFDRHWNDVTTNCRGLILNGQDEVVARPFPKFFNLGEDEDLQLPAEDFEVTDKLDGSLGILYPVRQLKHKNGAFYWKGAIATRGSFTSDQAKIATKIFQEKYQDWYWRMDRVTFLFEIIYPENRIVVDYGKLRDLVFLDAIDIATGESKPTSFLPPGMTRVKRYDGILDLDQLKEKQEDNREGYVIRFANGLRLKVKFDEYVRLHKIVTGINARHIWERLRSGEGLDEVLDRVPDEFYQWVKTTKEELEDQFLSTRAMCRDSFRRRPETEDRKEIAEFFKTQEYPAVLFKMLDDKPYEDIIWKIVKPQAEVPFKEEV